MEYLFVDTSALIAIGNKDDAFHRRAVLLHMELTEAKYRFLTTNAIILELFNAFSLAQHKPIALRLINLINDSKHWDCLAVDDLIVRGINRFENRLDKNWGLVDCISMLVAEDRGIKEIFTTDQHFKQAGFKILLDSQNLYE